MSAQSRAPMAVLFAGVLLGALDIAIVGPALPAIQRSFAADGQTLAWIMNVYVLGYLLGAPLFAKLSDRRGRRRVFAGCLGLFGVGSAVVAAAPALEVLLVGRGLQALGAGGLFPIASAVIADTVPEHRRGRALGMLGAVFGLAFLIGPVLGGLLLDFGWRWLFLVQLPLIAAVLAAALRCLPAGFARATGPFDWQGGALLLMMLTAGACGLGALLGDGAPDTAVAAAPLLLIAVAAACVPLLVRAEIRAADPLIDPALVAAPQIRVAAALAMVTGLVEACVVFLPSMAVAAFAVRESAASLMLLPLVMSLTVAAPLAGRLLDRIGPQPVIRVSVGLVTLGLAGLALLPPTRFAFFAGSVTVGLGLAGLLGAPLRYVFLDVAGPLRRGAGQGLFTLCLSGGRLLGAAAIGGTIGVDVVDAGAFRLAFAGLAAACAVAFVLSMAMRDGGRREIVE